MKHTFERYQLSEQLFESRNSIVYRALSTEEDKKVILKVLNTSYPTPTQIARFRHEHGLMQKLDSPHIPTVDGLIGEDTGAGIASEHHDQIFEPLFSTKTTGVGFGLRLCRQVMERHGGTIELVDTAESGTTFHLRLPQASKA